MRFHTKRAAWLSIALGAAWPAWSCGTRTFFGPDQAWLIWTPGMVEGDLPALLSFGFGNDLEVVVMAGNDATCTGVEPLGTLQRTGNLIRAEAMFNGPDLDGNIQECRFEVAGSANCAMYSALPAACALEALEDQVEIGSSAGSFEAAELVLFERCEAFPDLTGPWWLLNMHLLIRVALFDTMPIGAAVELTGRGDTVETMFVYQTDGSPCAIEFPDATLEITSEHLVIGAHASSDDADSCGVQFEGNLAYCAHVDTVFFFPPSSGLVTLLRFEGQGHWTFHGQTGHIGHMYIVVP